MISMSSLQRALALLLIALAAGLPVAAATFLNSERHVTIGAHQATVQPTLDAYATLDFGPLLPQVRIPADAPGPLGVEIDLGAAEVDSLEELLQRDAVIASAPQGEIATVSGAVTDMGADAAMRGLGVGALAVIVTVLVWRGVGAERRAAFVRSARRPSAAQAGGAVATGVVLVGALALVWIPDQSGEAPAREWAMARDVFPELPANPVLDEAELSQGTATATTRSLVEGALYLYDDSVSFYGALEEQAAQVEVRTPQDGETTALVVTDRHDNIGMDPVARRIADQAQAQLLIDLGDDTSQGGSWEAFSLNSLAKEFAGFEVVAVAGNHDTGRFVVDQMRDKGFTVLDAEPVEVGGVRFIGQNDPRGTTIAGYTEDAATRGGALAEQGAALREAACAADEAGERVPVVAVHSWASGKEVAGSGCVDLVLTGHLHYQVGPDAIETETGDPATRLTTASTGGAVLPIALGSKLRREAQVTIVTFDEDGVPVGLQVVSFTPAGVIDVADYVELPLEEEPVEPEPDPVEDPTAEETAEPEGLPTDRADD